LLELSRLRAVAATLVHSVEINVPLTTLERIRAVLGCGWDKLLG